MKFNITDLFSIYPPNAQVKLGANTTKFFDQLPPPTFEKLDINELRKQIADWDRDCALPYPDSIAPNDFIEEMIEDVPASVYRTPHGNSKTPTVLFCHGGGFFCELPNVHRSLMANIAARIPCHAVLPHYSLAPENKAPKAIEEMTSILHALLISPEKYGLTDELIVLGYSSGGNLAWTAVLNLLQTDNTKKLIKKVSNIILMSPWADISLEMTNFGAYAIQLDADKMLQTWGLMNFRDWYLPEGASGKEGCYSPLYRDISDMKEMPKTTIISGEADRLLTDSIAATYQIKKAGVPLQLLILEGQSHNHSAHMGLLDGVFTPDIISAIMRKLPFDELSGSDGLGLKVSRYNFP